MLPASCSVVWRRNWWSRCGTGCGSGVAWSGMGCHCGREAGVGVGGRAGSEAGPSRRIVHLDAWFDEAAVSAVHQPQRRVER